MIEKTTTNHPLGTMKKAKTPRDKKHKPSGMIEKSSLGMIEKTNPGDD